MSTPTIDTHAWYLNLKSAGFEDAQAEALTTLFKQTRETSGEQVDSTEKGLKEFDSKWKNHQLEMKWVLRIFTVVVVILVLKGM